MAAVMLLGMGLAMAACGGGSDGDDGNEGGAGAAATSGGEDTTTTASGSSASGSVDACSLLSDAKIEEALGLKVAAKGKVPGQGFSTSACGWELDSPTRTPGNPDFTLSVKTPGGKKQFDILANQGLPDIPGVGDAAYQQGDSLWAVKGDHLVVLGFGFLGAEIPDGIKVVPPLADEALNNI